MTKLIVNVLIQLFLNATGECFNQMKSHLCGAAILTLFMINSGWAAIVYDTPDGFVSQTSSEAEIGNVIELGPGPRSLTKAEVLLSKGSLSNTGTIDIRFSLFSVDENDIPDSLLFSRFDDDFSVATVDSTYWYSMDIPNVEVSNRIALAIHITDQQTTFLSNSIISPGDPTIGSYVQFVQRNNPSTNFWFSLPVGNNFGLRVTAVPEPNQFAFCLLGVAGCCCRRKRTLSPG
ncbi:hypothetical protein LOC67_02410 [Stieleria sp. JC731]|uniref:hypothetical protein n=1 Tax=Pirellulaceae TaxID=2691357 RepID=UPI001E2A5731|nr:hypothetical protein [Stieleria sp. JC731]MCC9599397.1 hypothetical protein [Stieleria sp. JC731]